MTDEKFIIGISDVLADSWMCDINTEDGDEVAYVVGCSKEHCESRAKKIAAAPALYEALEVLHKKLIENPPLWYINGSYTKTVLALQKATE